MTRVFFSTHLNKILLSMFFLLVSPTVWASTSIESIGYGLFKSHVLNFETSVLTPHQISQQGSCYVYIHEIISFESNDLGECIFNALWASYNENRIKPLIISWIQFGTEKKMTKIRLRPREIVRDGYENFLFQFYSDNDLYFKLLEAVIVKPVLMITDVYRYFLEQEIEILISGGLILSKWNPAYPSIRVKSLHLATFLSREKVLYGKFVLNDDSKLSLKTDWNPLSANQKIHLKIKGSSTSRH